MSYWKAIGSRHPRWISNGSMSHSGTDTQRRVITLPFLIKVSTPLMQLCHKVMANTDSANAHPHNPRNTLPCMSLLPHGKTDTCITMVVAAAISSSITGMMPTRLIYELISISSTIASAIKGPLRQGRKPISPSTQQFIVHSWLTV